MIGITLFVDERCPKIRGQVFINTVNMDRTFGYSLAPRSHLLLPDIIVLVWALAFSEIVKITASSSTTDRSIDEVLRTMKQAKRPRGDGIGYTLDGKIGVGFNEKRWIRAF